MPYELYCLSGVENDLRALPKKVLVSLSKKILALSKDPSAAAPVKLGGQENIWRIRHGEYRVMYEIQQKDLTIVQVKIGHRKTG